MKAEICKSNPCDPCCQLPFLWVSSYGSIWLQFKADKAVCVRSATSAHVPMNLGETIDSSASANWKKRLPKDQSFVLQNEV